MWTTDRKRTHLYREIMKEAILLGDKFLVEMVSMRIASLRQPSVCSEGNSNLIAFPQERLVAVHALKVPQKLWATVLLTAMIPCGIALFLVLFNYITFHFWGVCPG